MQWGALRGRTGNKGNVTPTLQLTVVHIELLSRLRHTHRNKLNSVSRITNFINVSEKLRSLEQILSNTAVGFDTLFPLYLIILAVGVVAATWSLLNALSSTQDVARITHTGLWAGPTAGRRFPRTCLLTGVCTRLIVTVGGAAQSYRKDGRLKLVRANRATCWTHSQGLHQFPNQTSILYIKESKILTKQIFIVN